MAGVCSCSTDGCADTATAVLACLQFTDKSGGTYRYTGIDSWCDAGYNKALNITPGPCLDVSMFVCEPLSNVLKPGIRAAIAVGGVVFLLIVGGTVAYFVLSKASKFRRFLVLNATRLKGTPRAGRMTLVVTDIEGYSGVRVCVGCVYVAAFEHAVRRRRWLTSPYRAKLGQQHGWWWSAR